MTRRIPAFFAAAVLAFAPTVHAEQLRFAEQPWWSFILSWLTPGAFSPTPGRLETQGLRNSVSIDPDGRTTTSPTGDTPAYGISIDPLGLTTTLPTGATPAYGGMIDPLGRTTTPPGDTPTYGLMIDPLG